LRARGQDTPTSASASTVAFLALGNGAATSPCTTVALATAKAYVVGDAVIADECGASAVTPTVASIEHPAFGSPAVTGLTSLTGNLQDPLALTPAPTGNCSGSNPAIGTPGNHPNRLSITAATGPVELLSGVYYLCNGLEIGAGASVVSGAGGVMFYLKGGTVAIDPAASVELTAIGTGDQKNILFWVNRSASIIRNMHERLQRFFKNPHRNHFIDLRFGDRFRNYPTDFSTVIKNWGTTISFTEFTAGH
jgi:hypothetical protein